MFDNDLTCNFMRESIKDSIPHYDDGKSPVELLEKQIITIEKSQKDMKQLLELAKSEAESAKKSSRISFICTIISISVSIVSIVVPLLLK